LPFIILHIHVYFRIVVLNLYLHYTTSLPKVAFIKLTEYTITQYGICYLKYTGRNFKISITINWQQCIANPVRKTLSQTLEHTSYCHHCWRVDKVDGQLWKSSGCFSPKCEFPPCWILTFSNQIHNDWSVGHALQLEGQQYSTVLLNSLTQIQLWLKSLFSWKIKPQGDNDKF